MIWKKIINNVYGIDGGYYRFVLIEREWKNKKYLINSMSIVIFVDIKTGGDSWWWEKHNLCNR